MTRTYAEAETSQAAPRIGPRRSRYRYVRRRWRWLAAAIDVIGRLLFAPARLRPRRAPSPLAPQRILLVQTDHLGDAVLSTGLLAQLRQRWPQAVIEVLSATWNASFFRSLPEVGAVHTLRRNRFAKGWAARGWLWDLLRTGWRLRRRRYDLAIDVRGEAPLALLIWLAGARRRVGWPAGGGSFLLTDPVEFVPGRPEAESRAALLAALDGHAEPASLAPRVIPNPRVVAEWARTLAPLFDRRGPQVILHPGAGTEAKTWPEAAWRELLGRLIVELDARVLLVGGPGDMERARRILEGREWPQVWDSTGLMGVDELGSVLSLADLFIGGDSGPAHLAAAVGAPVIALFSGTNDSRQWAPVGEQVTVLRAEVACSPCHRQQCYWADHPCLRQVTPEMVLRQAAHFVYDRRPAVAPDGPAPVVRRVSVAASALFSSGGNPT